MAGVREEENFSFSSVGDTLPVDQKVLTTPLPALLVFANTNITKCDGGHSCGLRCREISQSSQYSF